jgi:hypothetical protein
MRETIKLTSLSIVTALVLSGCGGSSSSDTTPEENSNSDIEKKTGYFIDAAVAGVDYVTTSELNGTTDRFGRFNYNDGDKVKLYIGKLLLGEVTPTEEGLITPKTLASQSEDSAKTESLILRVLQSLDNDSNTTNGITISQSTISSFSSLDSEIEISLLEENNLTAIPEIGSAIDNDNDGIIDVTEEEAQTHFNESIQTWDDGHRPDDNEVESGSDSHGNVDAGSENSESDAHGNGNADAGSENSESDSHGNGNADAGSENSESDAHGNGNVDAGSENSESDAHGNGNVDAGSENNESDAHGNGNADAGSENNESDAHGNGNANAGSENSESDSHGNGNVDAGSENSESDSHGNGNVDAGSENNESDAHGNGNVDAGSENNESDTHGNDLDLNDYPLATLTEKQKYALAYMWNEEKLAYDVYSELNKVQPQKQLENIATRSEIKHIQMVEDLVQKYDINITNLDTYEVKYSESELRALPVGTFGVEPIQSLYNTLYDKGIKSGQDALEVGCMVEVTDVNDLEEYITTAKEINATDLVDTFDKLKSGSYNHYWSFDKGLKNMGVTDGCCSLGTIDGVEYCQPSYPQNEESNGSDEDNNTDSTSESNTEEENRGNGNGNGNGEGNRQN